MLSFCSDGQQVISVEKFLMKNFVLHIFLGLPILNTFSFCLHTRNNFRLNRCVTQMNMIDRFFRVVSSNVNNLLKGLEDPEKILDQAVNDMQSDLIKIRQSYAEVSATQKRMAVQKQNADNLANVNYYPHPASLSRA